MQSMLLKVIILNYIYSQLLFRLFRLQDSSSLKIIHNPFLLMKNMRMDQVTKEKSSKILDMEEENLPIQMGLNTMVNGIMEEKMDMVF